MNPRLLRALLVAAPALLTTAQADHMSPWGPGWANMPNDIHNTRIDLRDDNDAFRDFVKYGEGADTTNRFLTEETAAVAAELASGHQVDQLAARLNPLPDFLGGGWARYSLFDGDTLVTRVLNINIRLRLVTKNGAVANESLGLTDGVNAVGAYFRYATPDANQYYATCNLVFDDVIDTDGDGVGDYAVYSLSLKEDPTGLVDGTGGCADMADAPKLPDVQLGDVIDIAVDAIWPVLQGDF
ncbi:exported hypothetical protein [Thiocapsa sp. KS1]|nr:exported hypothetical protein [Thiocapsa sp. KS1]